MPHEASQWAKCNRGTVFPNQHTRGSDLAHSLPGEVNTYQIQCGAQRAGGCLRG